MSYYSLGFNPWIFLQGIIYYDTSGSYIWDDNRIQLYLAIISEKIISLFIKKIEARLAETCHEFFKESTLKIPAWVRIKTFMISIRKCYVVSSMKNVIPRFMVLYIKICVLSHLRISITMILLGIPRCR